MGGPSPQAPPPGSASGKKEGRLTGTTTDGIFSGHYMCVNGQFANFPLTYISPKGAPFVAKGGAEPPLELKEQIHCENEKRASKLLLQSSFKGASF